MEKPWRRGAGGRGAALPDPEAPACARRSFVRLPAEERDRFLKAWHLLGGGGGVVTIAREGDMVLTGPGVCEALLARSWGARHHDPGEMLHLAGAARDVAEGLRPQAHGRRRTADLQARAWGELANALRVTHRLDAAEASFAHAFGRLEEGSGDPYLKAHLLELQASWLAAAGEPEAAQRRLGALAEIYLRLNEPHLAGRTAVAQTIHAFSSGQEAAALRLSAQGLARIDPGRDPGLATTALHNHLLVLTLLGRWTEAKRALAQHRGVARASSCALALRLRAMEGRICRGLGELGNAEAALRESRDGLAALGQGFPAAVASLDLALTLLRQEREEEARQEVMAALKLFLGLELWHELLGTVLFLDEAFRLRRITVELLEDTLTHLWRQETGRGPGPGT
jgi:tetratricopeptide (TPR) repeat protein